jgi:hypothetical protein
VVNKGEQQETERALLERLEDDGDETFHLNA